MIADEYLKKVIENWKKEYIKNPYGVVFEYRN